MYRLFTINIVLFSFIVVLIHVAKDKTTLIKQVRSFSVGSVRNLVHVLYDESGYEPNSVRTMSGIILGIQM